MKKLLIYILVAVAVSLPMEAIRTTAGAVGGEDYVARQEEVHSAAELLRELGLAEDDPAIKALQDEWWRCERMKNARYIGEYSVTGYDPFCTHCCGKCDGITASGAVVTEGYTVAMSGDFPFGTKIYIEGLGVFEVQDRGVEKDKIDIALGSHAECYAVTGRYDVWVLN